MENWRNYRNFRKHKNADGSYTYAITVDGADVEVSEAVYNSYAEIGYKMENMERGLKRDRVLQDESGNAVRDENGQAVILPEREVSLDKLISEDWDFPAVEPSPEDMVLAEVEIDSLRCCLGLLDKAERELIDALFYKKMSEREYARVLGISKTALHARKAKILAKLKNLMVQ